MPLDKLRWVQEVVNLLELVLVAGHPLVIDVGDEALAKLLYIVDSYVNIHLLLRLLHEVVLRQATVDDLLANLVSIIICLWLWQVDSVKVLGERPVWLVTGIDWLCILAIVSLHHSLRLVQILLCLLNVEQGLIRSKLIFRLLGHHCSVCHVPCQDRVRLLELASARKYMCSLNLRRGARHSTTAGYILSRASCGICRFFC